MYRLVNLLRFAGQKFIKPDFIDLKLHFQGLKINKIFCKKIVYCSQNFFFYSDYELTCFLFFSFFTVFVFIFLFLSFGQ